MQEVLLLLTISAIVQGYTHVSIKKEVTACKADRTDKDSEANAHHGLNDCQYKLSLSLTLTNEGKAPEDPRYMLVDSVYDHVGHEEVRLLNPIIIQIQQKQLVLAYPFSHQFSVNSGMYEVVLNEENTDGYIDCSVISDTLPDCQRLYDKGVHVKGFCCECDPDSRLFHHPRGGQSCKSTKYRTHSSSSSHCLRADTLWYAVNALSRPSVRHLLHIRMYQEWAAPPDGPREWKPLYNQDFLLGNDKINNSLQGVYGTYSTSFVHKVEPPIDYMNKLLLIPEPANSRQPPFHQDQIQEAGNYLVVDKDEVDRTGMSCDKIGVSPEAFIRQPHRCQQPAQSCLGKQPIHLWLDDQKALLQNKPTQYLLSSFAEPSPHPLIRMGNSSLITFPFIGTHTSHIYMEVNADKTFFLQRGAHGIIEEVYIESDASSTRVTVHILNSGLISSEFRVRIENCSGPGSHNYDVHSTHIGPQQSQKFVFSLHNIQPQDINLKTVLDNETCVVELLNPKGQKVAERMMPYNPLDRCACLAYCQCNCMSDGSLACRLLSQSQYNKAGYKGPVPTPIMEDPSLHKNLYPMEFAFIIITLHLFLGLCKMIGGALVSSKLGSLGLWLWMPPRLQQYHEPELTAYKVVYSHVIPVNPITGEPVRRLSWNREILMNTIFFFYAPFIPIHWCCNSLLDKLAQPKHVHDNQEYPQYVRRSLDEVLRISQQSENHLVRPLLPPDIKAKQESKLDKNSILEQFKKQKEFIKDQRDQPPCGDEELGPTPRMEEENKKLKAANSAQQSDESDTSSDEDEELSTEEMEQLARLSEPGTLVYNNYTEPNSHLWCSGDRYSLSGHLRRAGTFYKFSLGPQLTQLYDSSSFRGSSVLLTPLPINPKYFQEALLPREVLQYITDKPLYACLNIAKND